MTQNLIQELTWRGMIADAMPGTEEQLQKEPTVGYVGFDPTATSLHIGSLVPIILLMHMQKAGHKPIALIGGATGMVGDPSGKSAERNLLGAEELEANIAGIKAQLARFVRFDSEEPNGALLLNNYDWFKGISFLDFLRDTGKHITVNYMMSKESVKRRISGEHRDGLSYTEFAYQLLQGYDFYHLFQHHNCKLQFGGSDQWGNMTTGTELIRRKTGGEAFVFTCPLITKADGTKFGKTEGGNVWLDAERTSPYQFYQFWLNSSDADAVSWIKIFTFLPQEEITALTAAHQQAAQHRLLQKKLAEEVTRMVHGQQALDEAIVTTQKLFAEANKPVQEMTAEELENMPGVEAVSLPAASFSDSIDVVSLLADTGICPSRGEARKLVQNGGVSINREKVKAIDQRVDKTQLLHQRYLLVQRGKKNYYLLKTTD